MSQIAERFKRLKKEGRKAFIPYITAGYPSYEKTKEFINILEDCGADIIEIGVPFTDPVADGPVIQRAVEQALQGGMTLRRTISLVSEIRKHTSIPIVLMTYYNPVFKYREEFFIRDAKEAGVDGIIVPDLPPDEAGNLIRLSRSKGIDTIFMLAPTSTPDRIKLVAKRSRGFIYYVSITGITGARLEIDPRVREAIEMIKGSCPTPVCVGFGVSTPEEAKEVASISDWVIVGSAIVKRLLGDTSSLRAYLRALREAI